MSYLKLERLNVHETGNFLGNLFEGKAIPLVNEPQQFLGPAHGTSQTTSTALSEIFRRYNKASFGELVLLEILGKHQQGYTRGIWQRYRFTFTLHIL